MEALNLFHGVVLPRHNSKLIARIVEQYDRKRIDVQNISLSFMFALNQFERMNDFIDQASISRGWDRELHYWDIKAKIGMQMIEEARKQSLPTKKNFPRFSLTNLAY